MIHINYPPPRFRMREQEGVRQIWDAARKLWLVLTEEEWVRQNFAAYLTGVLHYPEALVAREKGIRVAGLQRRFDLLVYSRAHQPWMLVECKAPSVPLGEDVLQQALRYHLSVPVEYIVITNGDHTAAWQKKGAELIQLRALPLYGE